MVLTGPTVLSAGSMAAFFAFLGEVLFLSRSQGSVFHLRVVVRIFGSVVFAFVTALNLDLQDVYIVWIVFCLRCRLLDEILI